MNTPQIGCQLIIFGQRNRDDLAGCLQEVAQAGYAGVEMGLHADPAWLADTLAALNLRLAGLHSGYNDVHRVDAFADLATKLGAKHVMCSGVSERTATGYARSAKVFNVIGAEYKAAGITFCYHHHSWEFEQFGDKTGWDILVDGLDPEMVSLNVDTYWAKHGGFDPVEFCRQYLDRIAYLHCKDMGELSPEEKAAGKHAFREVGQGTIDFAAVHAVLSAKPIAWYTVEQDRTERTPLESITLSRTYIREKLGL